MASDSVSLPDNSDDSVVGPLPQIHSTKKHVCDTSTHGTSTSSSMMSHDQSAYSSDSARAVPEHLMRIAEESDDEIVFERSLHSPRSYRISRMVQSVSPRWNRMYHRSPAKGASKFAFDDVSLGDSRASHMRDDNTEVATEIAGNLTSTKFQRDISDESVFSDTLALNSLVTPLEQNASEPMDFLDRTVAAVMEEKGPIQKIDKNQELTLPTGSQDLTEKIDSFDHAETKEFPRWMVVAFAAFGSMALIVAVVLIVVAGPNKLKDLVDGSTPVSASPGGERAKVMWEIASSVSGSEVLSDVDSHAFKAFSWLSQSDNTALTTPHDKLIDRYIVTLLYFATGGEGWEEQLNFLTEGSICGWNESNEGSKLPRGIVCDDKLRVKNLILSEYILGYLRILFGV